MRIPQLLLLLLLPKNSCITSEPSEELATLKNAHLMRELRSENHVQTPDITLCAGTSSSRGSRRHSCSSGRLRSWRRRDSAPPNLPVRSPLRWSDSTWGRDARDRLFPPRSWSFLYPWKKWFTLTKPITSCQVSRAYLVKWATLEGCGSIAVIFKCLSRKFLLLSAAHV